MRIEDVDFKRRTILVRGKGSSRTVYFGRPAKKALTSYLGKRKEGIVFLTDNPRQHGSISPASGQWNGYWRDYSEGRDLVRTRVIYLGPMRLTRAQAWKRFKKLIPNPNLDQPERKTPITIHVIFRAFQLASHNAGLGRITSHQMRHSFATHLLDHGANVRQIQHLLGHKCLNTTQTYTRVANRNLENAYRKFHPRS